MYSKEETLQAQKNSTALLKEAGCIQQEGGRPIEGSFCGFMNTVIM